jgi:hypothetical protein
MPEPFTQVLIQALLSLRTANIRRAPHPGIPMTGAETLWTTLGRCRIGPVFPIRTLDLAPFYRLMA